MTGLPFTNGKKVVFLGGPYDKFSFAVWEAGKKVENVEQPSKFTMEFDNGKTLNLTGQEADAMSNQLIDKASQ